MHIAAKSDEEEEEEEEYVRMMQLDDVDACMKSITKIAGSEGATSILEECY